MTARENILQGLALIDPARGDVSGLVAFIEGTDFFKAPASTQYHLSVQGGLALHSWNVYQQLQKLAAIYYPEAPLESLIIVGLLHDICKANFYAIEMRNAKDERGNWTKVPYYTVKDADPLGHGEKSVILLQRFIRITTEEALAIRWHMGAWSAEGYEARQALNAAMGKCPLLNCLMMADQAATMFVEGKDCNK